MDEHLPPDARLAARASRQRGLFTHRDAVAAGLSQGSLDARIQRGAVVRLDAGLYAIAGHEPTRRRDLQAALLKVGGEAALARQTAAEIHDLPLVRDSRIHVVVRDRSFHGTRRIAMHRTTWWREDHVTEVDGLRTTTVPRTIVDIASQLSFFQLRKLVTHAVRHRLADVRVIRDHLDLAGRVRGAVNLREILDQVSPLESRTASTLESAFLDLATRAGVPPTHMNYPVVDIDGVQRFVDAIYLPERVPVELDGELWHGLATDRIADRERERAILATGRFRPFLRFSWDDITQHPRKVIAELRTALAAADRIT